MTRSTRSPFTRLRVLCVVGGSVLSIALAINGLAQLTKQNGPEVRQKTFDVVWKTVNDKYFDPHMGGVNWAAIRKRYEPQVASVQSEGEFQDLLARMLNELKVSHLHIVDLATLDNQLGRAVVTRGLALRDVNNQVVVTRIIDGSPAAAAELRPGFIVTAIDDVPVANARSSETILAMDNVKRRLTIVDEANKTRGIQIGYALPAPDKHESARIGPATRHVLVETKTLEDGIGYIYFTNFITPLKKRIVGSFDLLRNAPGLIIDLRGNSGGETEVGLLLAGMLVDKETPISFTQTRKGVDQYKARPSKNRYRSPVVILLDEECASESEEMAAGLQAIGRVVVIGRTSRGEDMDATIQGLPMASLLLEYPVGLPRTPKGVAIEGHGVIPDLDVKLTRDELLKGNDSQLEAAIRHILRSAQ
jgi:carboxyl-terminal processing protease